MTELKPCPFCGGTDLHFESFSGWGNDVIICHKCLSIFSQQEITCEEDLITAWNRRASGWISVEDDKPKNHKAVNVVWVNHEPVSYYAYMKDVPQSGTAHYYEPKDRWYWDSTFCDDYLDEYGDSMTDRVDKDVEITHWQPFPAPPEVETDA